MNSPSPRLTVKYSIPIRSFAMLAYWASLAQATAYEYRITEVGPPTDYQWIGGGGELNNLGQIVDTWSSPTLPELPKRVPFIWSADEGAHALDGFDGSARGLGLNDSGQVIGVDETTNRTFLRSPDGESHDLGTLGTVSRPSAINELGQVVGYSTLDSGETHAFFWNGGGMIDLGSLGGNSFASDVNDLGQVIGVYSPTIPGEERAFIWDNANGMRGLGIIGDRALQLGASAINNLGTVVGGYQATDFDPSFGYIWDEDRGMRPLEFSPSDINDAGTIIGHRKTSNGLIPVIWDEDRGMRDLNDLFPHDRSVQLPLLVDTVSSINDRGQILATIAAGSTELAVLTPISGSQPEPLQAGDANQDGKFDQSDIGQVFLANKYLTDLPATWGEGDWNGASGGQRGSPPAGDGVFDQFDLVAALAPGHYLSGRRAALAGKPADFNDEQTSLFYDIATGELSVDAPTSTDLTSINIASEAGLFVGDKPSVLDGAFDNFDPHNIFKATFGGSFGDISFGNVLPAGLTFDDIVADLTVVGSLDGGGDLGPVDCCLPEPSTLMLAVTAAFLIVLPAIRVSRRRSPATTAC